MGLAERAVHHRAQGPCQRDPGPGFRAQRVSFRLARLTCSHEIATSSQDNTVRIWDMRTLRSIFTIPAHRDIVSEVRYYRGPVDISRQIVDPDTKAHANIVIPVNGLYLATSSFDGFVKMWSADDYRLVHAIPAHEGKVMSLDISADNKMLATAGYDRTFKLFASDEVVL